MRDIVEHRFEVTEASDQIRLTNTPDVLSVAVHTRR
jgi:hypothetical protein